METINPLAKLVNRARKKLNKSLDKEENIKQEKRFEVEYIFKIYDDKKEQNNFINKVYKILDKDPDCTNPIGQLIDNKLFKSLDEPQKERYIQNLTNNYLKVLCK